MIELVAGLLLVGGGVAGCIQLQKYIKGLVTDAIKSILSISPEEAADLRNQIKLVGLQFDNVDMKIEKQLKPQIEKHHEGLLILNGDLKHLYDVLNGVTEQ